MVNNSDLPYSNVTMANKPKQQGATLLIVLVILILITSISIVVIKNSHTDLRVATAQQAKKILFQSNNASFNKFEEEDRLNDENPALDDLKLYITSSQVKNGEEVVFCVRHKNKELFRLDQMTVKTLNGDEYASRNNGYCDPSNENDYINEGRVMTQLTFVKEVPTDATTIWSGETRQTGSNDLPNQTGKSQKSSSCVRFTGFSTSLMPALSDARQEDIGVCFTQGYADKHPVTGAVQITIDDCLSELGVIHETQIQEYRNVPRGNACI